MKKNYDWGGTSVIILLSIMCEDKAKTQCRNLEEETKDEAVEILFQN